MRARTNQEPPEAEPRGQTIIPPVKGQTSAELVPVNSFQGDGEAALRADVAPSNVDVEVLADHLHICRRENCKKGTSVKASFRNQQVLRRRCFSPFVGIIPAGRVSARFLSSAHTHTHTHFMSSRTEFRVCIHCVGIC